MKVDYVFICLNFLEKCNHVFFFFKSQYIQIENILSYIFNKNDINEHWVQ